MKKGITLVEILVAMAVFTVLMTSVTMVLTATLRAANRAAVVTKIKSEGTYIMDSMATVLRYAESVSCSPDGIDGYAIANLASATNNIFYDCLPVPNRIASDSVALNSSEVLVSGCQIIPSDDCSRIDIQFSLQDASGVLGTPVSFSSQLELRNQ